jgi:hypothetical protein
MPTPEEPDKDLLRLELQEALGAFRSSFSLTNQAFGIIATGLALLVTYGFTQRLAITLSLASTLPIAALLVYLQSMSEAAKVASLAVRLERRLGLDDALATVYARKMLSSASLPIIHDITDEDIKALDRGLIAKLLKNIVSLILYASTVATIALAILSMAVYHFKFM